MLSRNIKTCRYLQKTIIDRIKLILIDSGHTNAIVRCHFMSQSDFCSMKIFTINKRILDTMQVVSKLLKVSFKLNNITMLKILGTNDHDRCQLN